MGAGFFGGDFGTVGAGGVLGGHGTPLHETQEKKKMFRRMRRAATLEPQEAISLFMQQTMSSTERVYIEKNMCSNSLVCMYMRLKVTSM